MATSPARSDFAPFEGQPPPASLRPKFQRTMDYLDALPDGIYSYPECQARSGILQTFLESRPPPVGEQDPWVVGLLSPTTRSYIPEVVSNAGLLAIGDAAGLTDAQWLAWNHEANRALFRGLLYRALMAIFSPMMLLERAPARWESFHVGTSLTLTKGGEREAIVRLAFPERLHLPLHLEAYGRAFAAAMEHARGRDVSVELLVSTATSAEYRARWK
jgi:hypothetical protein